MKRKFKNSDLADLSKRIEGLIQSNNARLGVTVLRDGFMVPCPEASILEAFNAAYDVVLSMIEDYA